MNWKINFWTLLFALAALALLILLLRPNDGPLLSPGGGISVPMACDTSKRIDTIPATVAHQRIAEYFAFSQLAEMAIKKIQEDTSIWKPIDSLLVPTNIGLVYFHLPRCELDQMLRQIPDGDVYALPILEPDPNYPAKEAKKRISMIFHDRPYPVPPKRETYDVGDDGEYYDFIDPCPNSCGQ